MDEGFRFAIKVLDIALPVMLLIWAVIFSILGIVLKFHWARYGVEKNKSKKMFILYFVVGLVFIVSMFMAYIFYLTNK